MKKDKRFSRKNEKKVIKSAVFVKAVLRKQRKRRLSDEDYVLCHNYGESYNQKEKEVIMNCLRFETEGSWDEPWDGYYYYELKPGAKFRKLIPRMHKYHEAREWLSDYEPLHEKHQEAYAREICKHGVTKEIEMAFIWGKYYYCGGPWYKMYGNVLVRLKQNGHKFSEEARQAIKKHDYFVYRMLFPEDCRDD